MLYLKIFNCLFRLYTIKQIILGALFYAYIKNIAADLRCIYSVGQIFPT